MDVAGGTRLERATVEWRHARRAWPFIAERWISWPLLLTAIAAILFWRSSEVLLRPTIPVEDGASIFAYFYENREWDHILRFKSGYLPLLPNVIGYLSVRVPVEFSPFLLTIVPTFLALLSFSLFFSKRYRYLVRDDATRFVICLALALAPVGQMLLVSHTDYSTWSVLFITVLAALAPFPFRASRGLGSFLLQQLLVWTHPLSFIAAPLNAFHLVTTRNWLQRGLQLAMLASHALHLKYGLAPRAASRAADRLVDLDRLAQLALRAWNHFLDEGLFRTVFAAEATARVAEQSPSLFTWFGAAFLACAGLALCKSSTNIRRRTYILLLFAVATLMLVIVASKGDTQILRGRRYMYVQALLLVVLFCVLTARLSEVLAGRSSLTPNVLRYWAGRLCLVAPLAVFGHHNFLNDRLHYADTWGKNGADRVRACMQRIAALEEQNGGPCGVRVRCKKIGRDWPIAIKTAPCAPTP